MPRYHGNYRPLDTTDISTTSAWSSQRTANEIAAIDSLNSLTVSGDSTLNGDLMYQRSAFEMCAANITPETSFSAQEDGVWKKINFDMAMMVKPVNQNWEVQSNGRVIYKGDRKQFCHTHCSLIATFGENDDDLEVSMHRGHLLTVDPPVQTTCGHALYSVGKLTHRQFSINAIGDAFVKDDFMELWVKSSDHNGTDVFTVKWVNWIGIMLPNVVV